MMWNAIQWITGTFTFLAFLFAVIATVYRWKLQHEENLLKSAPDGDRTEILLSRYGAFSIDTDSLTKQQKFDLAITQIQGRAERFKVSAIIIGLIGVLLASITVFAIVKSSDSKVLEEQVKGRDALIFEIRDTRDKLRFELNSEKQKVSNLIEHNKELAKLLTTLSNNYVSSALTSKQLEIVVDAKRIRTEAERSIEQLLNAAGEGISDLEHEIFKISPDTLEKYKEFTGKTTSDVIKLLPSGKYDKYISVPKGGSWYSFKMASHNYHNEADILLSEDDGEILLETGQKGLDYGFFLSLGDVPFIELLNEKLLKANISFPKALEYIWNYTPPQSVKRCRLEGMKLRVGIPTTDATLTERVNIQPQTSYFLRSINDRLSDLLVAIRVEKIFDDGSIELIWKIIKQYPIPNAKGSEPYPFSIEMGDLLSLDLSLNRDISNVNHNQLTDFQLEVLSSLLDTNVLYRGKWDTNPEEILIMQSHGLIALWPPIKTVDNLINAKRKHAYPTQLGKIVRSSQK